MALPGTSSDLCQIMYKLDKILEALAHASSSCGNTPPPPCARRDFPQELWFVVFLVLIIICGTIVLISEKFSCACSMQKTSVSFHSSNIKPVHEISCLRHCDCYPVRRKF